MKSNALRLLPLLSLLLGSALAGSLADFGARTGKPDPEQAGQLNLPANTGHLITEVFPGSPAAQLGLAKGDLVLSIDGVPARNIVPLADVVATNHAPQQEIEVTWSRAGQQSSAKVKLGEGCERRDFSQRYQKNFNPDYAFGQNVDFSRTTSTTFEEGHAITFFKREGDRQKVRVMRQDDKKVLFDGELTIRELDKLSAEIPAAAREMIGDRIEQMTHGLRIIPLQGRQSQGAGQPQQPEHDVNDLLKKLEAGK